MPGFCCADKQNMLTEQAPERLCFDKERILINPVAFVAQEPAGYIAIRKLLRQGQLSGNRQHELRLAQEHMISNHVAPVAFAGQFNEDPAGSEGGNQQYNGQRTQKDGSLASKTETQGRRHDVPEG